MTIKTILITTFCTLTLIAVSGCSELAKPGVDAPTTESIFGGTEEEEPSISVSRWKEGDDVPDFKGPWKASFEQAYKETTSDAQRKILEDEEITEEEISSLFESLRSCLYMHGYSDFSYESDTTYSVRMPEGMSREDTERIDVECNNSTVGTVDIVYNNLRKNPEAENHGDLMASCLARLELAPEGYTGAQYYRDSPDKYPFDSDDPRFGKCISDPKNARK